ncbi:Brp/Blh family beta-carotene 15,15'-dioxygenase [Tuwongella immobilis]|uniref:Probable beta-carotene 15,15'-dioxygenase n=1 Tax=Tuwongella immobilis TaxID=692036 RepID=A0A6C2YNG2_9BACT|nr:Brp/Blh family beta-carotene 15,15'-dioxygenase [Tuwongella immobilis]VIP02739.1 membrane protein : Uncharacterized protein OS=Methylobacterium mesophilicum SR1.6/6 GN=MmSR116_1494 PE=4 SV=1: BCD [Tuwongella immobilis]VTS02307.1 membrane protein : Uncharacterized protein OS=Methylobacterium mesophilicum SR1.6/6 GN=MmSR116_1494 PE=4 SV=1: BCD [Tuwongella immobilis]
MPLQAIAFVCLVALVGMPHGGLDHRFGRMFLRPKFGRHWVMLFATGYLGIMMLVLLGWLVMPLVTLAGFVLLSAIHFGLAESMSSRRQTLVRLIAVGGLVVWVPALLQPQTFTELLSWVVPNQRWPSEMLFRPETQSLLGLLVITAILSRFMDGLRAGLITLGFIGIFAFTPPLVGFLIYFCGWHSAWELVRLARFANDSNPRLGFLRVAWDSLPLSMGASLLIALGWWLTSGHPIEPKLVQAGFIGLSVVAVPHLLLHWAVPDHQNPFAEVSP